MILYGSPTFLQILSGIVKADSVYVSFDGITAVSVYLMNSCYLLFGKGCYIKTHLMPCWIQSSPNDRKRIETMFMNIWLVNNVLS